MFKDAQSIGVAWELILTQQEHHQSEEHHQSAVLLPGWNNNTEITTLNERIPYLVLLPYLLPSTTLDTRQF